MGGRKPFYFCAFLPIDKIKILCYNLRQPRAAEILIITHGGTFVNRQFRQKCKQDHPKIRAI